MTRFAQSGDTSGSISCQRSYIGLAIEMSDGVCSQSLSEEKPVEMGTLAYDVVSKVEFDDRTLVHLQIVIASKLRRGESFNLSWTNEPGGTGRTTVWMHPAIPLVYEFRDSATPSINREWLNALMETANSPTGLRLIPEPSESEALPSTASGAVATSV
jgi:hypothetical protein